MKKIIKSLKSIFVNFSFENPKFKELILNIYELIIDNHKI